MKIETERLELVALKLQQLKLWVEGIKALEQNFMWSIRHKVVWSALIF